MGAEPEIQRQGNPFAIGPLGETLDSRHPLISRYDNVVGGEPVIAGTRITVRAIVEYDRLYSDSERTLRALPHLSIEQIQDALRYYHDHPIEIERLMAENERVYEAGASKSCAK